jgi:hypothetical protein
VGSKKPKVIVRPQRALLDLGAPNTFHGRHSNRVHAFNHSAAEIEVAS